MKKSQTPSKVKLYVGIIHIYLDEHDNCPDNQKYLKANGFTEPTRINDFPIRDRKVLLHVRRRRRLDEKVHNVIVNAYPLATDGTCYSEEFRLFLKKLLDTSPVTARSVGQWWMIDGGNLEKAYKNHFSGFRTWDQLDHASDWMLLERNCGQRLSIDETP